MRSYADDKDSNKDKKNQQEKDAAIANEAARKAEDEMDAIKKEAREETKKQMDE